MGSVGTKTVKIYGPNPERVVEGVIASARAKGEVSFAVKSRNGGVTTIVLSGTDNPLTRVYNWGVSKQLW